MAIALKAFLCYSLTRYIGGKQPFAPMNADLQRRIDRIKQLAEEFNLNQTKIGEYAARSRTTVTKVFGGQDERSLTESNVAAIEQGIERILGEYRRKLCN